MLRHKRHKPTRQWNDWRCYRCGRWQPADSGLKRTIESPIGALTIHICSDCAAAVESPA